ncbi:hypothetical protein BOTBODRAFT_48693 [Botryobasidium botryosum FD-172 SS1]|uniref:Uncharacterized protein n=1 Tax=Botryobasidium botryosum (strain FD-172 SS1) TaxID=930990 RepID=A0A067LYX8_BOTB1|nr:hypothetical protein BOTBODRAFT_48693 [Botryobasidium botryosum FD-172 SS1]
MIGLRSDAHLPLPPVPIEITLLIFELACTDGGHTASVLCLVSKRFNELAAPLLHRSIAVSGVEKISGLLSRLEEDSRLASMVRHLFIAERAPPPGKKFMEENPPVFDSALYEKSNRLSRHIITLVGPSLETLSYFPYDVRRGSHLCDLLTLPLPCLRELTINRGQSIPFSMPLPALERLHLYTPHPSSMLRNLDVMCPRLTHLKATGFGSDSKSLDIGLRQHWGVPLHDRREIKYVGLMGAFRLPQLQRIILQPFSYETVRNHDGNKIEGKYKGAVDKSLAKLLRARRGRGLGLQAPIDSKKYQWKAKEDWLGRLSGGKGCWVGQQR